MTQPTHDLAGGATRTHERRRSGDPVGASRPETAPQGRRRAQRLLARLDRAPWAAAGVLGLLAALPLAALVWRHPVGRDEGATLYAASLSPHDLVETLRATDGIFALYYGSMHLVTLLGGGLEAMRLISVAAFGVTVASTARLGHRAGGAAGLLAAGLLTAMNPVLVIRSQEARPYALAAAAITAAALMLAPTLEREEARRWRLWAAAGAVVLATYWHLFALLAGFALVVGVLLAGARRDRRTVRALWPVALATLIAVAPLLVVGATQRAQVSWITRLGVRGSAEFLLSPAFTISRAPGGLAGFFLTNLAGPLVALALLLMAVGSRRAPGPARLLGPVALTWLLLPPLALIAAAVVSPMTTRGYVLFSAPAVGLLAACAVASRRPMALAGVALAVLLALPAGATALRNFAYDDDFEGVTAVLRERAQHGDVLLVPSSMAAGGIEHSRPEGLLSWPAGTQRDLQRWNVDESWRPGAGVDVWVADFQSPFDADDLARFEQQLVTEGYRQEPPIQRGATFVHHFVAPR